MSPTVHNDHVAEQSRDAMVAGLTNALIHDLNNPLAGILGYSQYLAKKSNVPSELREPLNDIYVESTRLNRILSSFARLCTQDAGACAFFMNEAVHEVLSFQRKRFERRGAMIHEEIPEDLEVINLRNTFQQAIFHALNVAALEIPADGSGWYVALSANRSTPQLRIAVHGRKDGDPIRTYGANPVIPALASRMGGSFEINTTDSGFEMVLSMGERSRT